MTYTPVDVDKIRQIAAQVDEIAARYRRIADDMELIGIESIDVRGLNSLFDAAIPRLQGNVNSMEKAFRDAQTQQKKTSVMESRTEFDVEEEHRKASQAYAADARRKRAQGSSPVNRKRKRGG